MLDRIKSAVTSWIAERQSNGQRRQFIDGYEQGLGRMLLDLNLTDSEMAALAAQQRSLKLDARAVQKVHVDAVRHLSQQLIGDGVISLDEIDAMGRIMARLNVKWTDLPRHHLESFRLADTCLKILNGNLPQIPSGESHLREKPGEVVHMEIGCRMLDEKVVRRQISGRSSGVSIRLFKGVSYRVGGTRGHSIPVTEVVVVDEGVLSVTNLRLAFTGKRKSFSVLWPKVLSVEPHSDGVQMSFESRTKSVSLQYEEPGDAEIYASLFGWFMR